VSEDLEKAVGPDRRTFIKRLVIGSAFAAPVVSSFTMSGVHALIGVPTGAVNPNTTPPEEPPQVAPVVAQPTSTG